LNKNQFLWSNIIFNKNLFNLEKINKYYVLIKGEKNPLEDTKQVFCNSWRWKFNKQVNGERRIGIMQWRDMLTCVCNERLSSKTCNDFFNNY